MNNENDLKRNINEELTELRQRVAELEAIETEREEKEQWDLESRRKRDKNNALVLAGLPIFLGIILFIINRPYIMQFFNPATRTCGLSLLVTTIVLAAAAYPALRGSFSVIESGRQSLGLLRAILVIAFLILPAILILLLGPAAMLLLSSPLEFEPAATQPLAVPEVTTISSPPCPTQPAIEVVFVLYAAQDIPPGTVLSREMFVAARLPANLVVETMIAGLDAEDLFAQVAGNRAKIEIPRGIIISSGLLEAP